MNSNKIKQKENYEIHHPNTYIQTSTIAYYCGGEINCKFMGRRQHDDQHQLIIIIISITVAIRARHYGGNISEETDKVLRDNVQFHVD